jgi:hypothetical protein
MAETRDNISSAVSRALREPYPEDGLSLYLKDYVISGHRGEVTDRLIDTLCESTDSDLRHNALTLLYFLHATQGKIMAPGMIDPRPENAQWDESLNAEQFDRLAEAALAEEDRSLWESYCSLFDCLHGVIEFPIPVAGKLKRFALKCLEEGSDDTCSRCKRLAKLRL